MVKKQSPNAWPQGAYSVAVGIRHGPVVKEEQNLAAGNTLKMTKYQNSPPRTSVVVQWKNSSSNAADVGSIPGGGTKIPHAAEQLSPRAAMAKPRGPQLGSLRATNYRAQELWNPQAAPTYHNQDPTCHN